MRLALSLAGLALALATAPAQTPAAKPTAVAGTSQKEMRKAERLKKRDQDRVAAEAALKANRPTGPRASFPDLAPAKPSDPAAVARQIDALLTQRLQAEGVAPSPRADDAEYLRRASLDITGVIPSLDQTRQFLASADPLKRKELIADLLTSPNYGRHQSDLWVGKLFEANSDNRFVPKAEFAEWLAKEFNANTHWGELTTKIVTAEGSVGENPAVVYYLANRSADKITDTLTQHFLGIQLQCAQCHNHPFTTWKQDEYWQLAAFVSKVQPQRPANVNKGGDPLSVGVTEGAARSKAKEFFPEAAKELAPKFLGGPDANIPAKEAYRPDLARWMTSPANPFFARAMVNRTWAQMFGRGLVHPVDDMHEDNAATHPEVLTLLTAEFAKSGYDVKHLIRTLALTEAYHRTSRPAGNNGSDEELYSHMPVRVMTPEMLHDSLQQIVAVAPARRKAMEKMAELKKGRGPTPRDNFVQFFLAGTEVPTPTEYEAGIPQALRLMNGRQFDTLAVARTLVPPRSAPAEALETLMLLTLNRRPTPAEKAKLLGLAKGADSPTEAAGDLLWALVNSSEFTMVR